MATHGVFPFGHEVKVLRQRDRSPKKVFVLGVYASAVHARWVDRDGKQKVAALAVSSEPYLFWKGDGADSIVATVHVPAALGKLFPADRRLNGPSGRSLDDRFLRPLGLSRQDAWLCDIYPYAMVNPDQLAAIRREYTPQVTRFHLPEASLERAPTRHPGKDRVSEILAEIRESRAKTLILLGDRPIQWFLKAFHGEIRRLSDFGRNLSEYGVLRPLDLDGYKVNVLPLVHPRQASRLGRSTAAWGLLHDEWVQLKAPTLL